MASSLDMASQDNLPIHSAAAVGLESEVISLCTNSDLVNAANYVGWTPIMYGAYYGHLDVVKALLSLGADVSLKNKFGGCAYTLAPASGNVGIMRILHSCPGITAEKLAKSLAVAVVFGHLSVVRFLIDNGADPNSPTEHSGVVPLMLAVAENQFEIAKFLILRGADVTIKNCAGYSALQLAIITERKNMILFFRENLGSDSECVPAYETCKNKEAVVQAARSGDLFRLKSLLSHNPSLSSSQHWMTSYDEDNRTGLGDDDVFESFEDDKNKSKQKLRDSFCHRTHPSFGSSDKTDGGDLLGLCYSPFTSSFHYNSCSDSKHKLGDHKNILFDRELKSPAKSASGSELYLPVASSLSEEGSKKMVSHIKKGMKSHSFGSASELLMSEVNKREEEEIVASPLILACFNGHVEAARLLITAGADPNRQRKGRTPLMLAAITSNMELMKLLLSAGADPLVESCVDGLTAFELASLSGAGTEVLRLIACYSFPILCDDYNHAKSLKSLGTPNKVDNWKSPHRILTKLQSILSPRLQNRMHFLANQSFSDSKSSRNKAIQQQKIKKSQHKAARKLFSTPMNFISSEKESAIMENLQRWKHAFPKSSTCASAAYFNHSLFIRPFDTPFESLPSDEISKIMPPPYFESSEINIIEEIKLRKNKVKLDENIQPDAGTMNDKKSTSISPESPVCCVDAVLMASGAMSISVNGLERLESILQTYSPLKENSNNLVYFGGNFDEYIEKHNLKEYSSLFSKNEVTDIDILLSLTEDDLIEMGVMSAEERRDILSKIHYPCA